MKRPTLIFIATIMLFWCATGAAADRFITNGKSELPLADPYVLCDRHTYYAYGTHSEDGIAVYLSSDLKTWKYGGLALNKCNTTERRWFWAPEVYRIGGTYYMYYSANEHLYCATAASPLGPFHQVGGPFLEEGSIDGTLFRDDDGAYYLFFVRFNDGNNIWVARMSDDLTAIRKETLHHCISVSQTWETDAAWPGSRVNEGPFVVKKEGVYYLTYSANDYRSLNYAVGFATASKITGPWTKATDNPIFRRPDGLVGVGHHSFFKDRQGHWQMIFHAHHSASHVHPRLSYIVPFRLKKGRNKLYRFDFGRHILAPKVQ